MPFERLMELVSGLSDEDKALPMGRLAERWGEPAHRIMDAVDAVRVMHGERTYITLKPGPEMVPHIVYCRSCQRAWYDGDEVTCSCSAEDWVTDPDPATIPEGAWVPPQDTGR